METVFRAVLLLIVEKKDLLQRKYASITAGNSCHKAVRPSVGFQKFIIWYEVA
jgi:hypothetical protein